DVDDAPVAVERALSDAEVIFHLAGVNRPKDLSLFEQGNAFLLETLCNKLRELKRAPKIVLTSSIQADLDNPYGLSKRHAEEILKAFAGETGAECVAYRLKNLFGKWCRPNYNSVTATFCHNIANGLPIQISNSANVVDLTYIDDVVAAFVAELQDAAPGFRFADTLPSHRITLGELADKLHGYKMMRETLLIPDLQNDFERALFGTYLSYLAEDDFAYGLDTKSDQRGSLAEFIKSSAMGQIFVSHTKPGVTRGDHYHRTKAEKFLVVQGTAVIRFRHIESDQVIEYKVRGEEYKVLDIPPGYTHSIENVGNDDLVTLFWACEMFDPQKPDTYYEKVLV
ncbi:MAG: NAD-dependent epimerase/dehydratase family protein, partial [Desulfatitalea sp.]|nr:NAD-dependent epimerase/dehydratase family protein [Desulfatitalea sp.]